MAKQLFFTTSPNLGGVVVHINKSYFVTLFCILQLCSIVSQLLCSKMLVKGMIEAGISGDCESIVYLLRQLIVDCENDHNYKLQF